MSNGSFESGYASWTATGNQEVSTDGTAGGTDGTHFVWFNAGQRAPNGVLSQSFATAAGTSYTLTFDLGTFSFVNRNEQRIQVLVKGTATLLNQSLSVFASGTGARYAAQSLTFVADSSATTLTFTDVSPTTTDVDMLLDHVQVSSQTGLAAASSSSQPNLRLATIQRSLAPESAALTLSLTGSGVLIEASVLPGQPYRVDRSADLLTWTTLRDVIADEDGVLMIEDDDTSGSDMFFYRVVAAAPEPGLSR